MDSINEAAKELWAQIFNRATKNPGAALYNPEGDDDKHKRMEDALLAIGWERHEIAARIEADRVWATIPNLNSPGVAPGLEAQLRLRADRISGVLSQLGLTAQEKIEFAIDPKAGVEASLTNVIMTDEAILTVSAFLFRWCGLIARAYTRTLMSDLGHWVGPITSSQEDVNFLLRRQDLFLYWSRIFMSFSLTGTHVSVPYLPCARNEVLLMEQVAWSMEYFTIAHEFSHHMLRHRSVEDDPIAQENEADRYAINVCEYLQYEPFVELSNPYLVTGAGATLMLRALTVLNGISASGAAVNASVTHPPAESRITKIMNRNALEPSRFKMDCDFNSTVLRVMAAVEEVMRLFVDAVGRDTIEKLQEPWRGSCHPR